MKVIPGIDLMNGKVVRLFKGDYSKVIFYGEPLQWAVQWINRGANTLHVVDLDGARTGSLKHLDTVKQLLELGVKIHLGGGIRTPKDVEHLLSMGVDKIMVGSGFWEAPGSFEAFVPGILPAFDIKQGRLMVSGWQKSGPDVVSALEIVRNMGVKRVLFTGVSRDGTGSGPDLRNLETLIEAGLEIIVAGGISTIHDLDMLSQIPQVKAAVIGKALYQGLIKEDVFPCWPKE